MQGEGKHWWPCEQTCMSTRTARTLRRAVGGRQCTPGIHTLLWEQLGIWAQHHVPRGQRPDFLQFPVMRHHAIGFLQPPINVNLFLAHRLCKSWWQVMRRVGPHMQTPTQDCLLLPQPVWCPQNTMRPRRRNGSSCARGSVPHRAPTVASPTSPLCPVRWGCFSVSDIPMETEAKG